MIPPKGTICVCKLHKCPVRMVPPRADASLNSDLNLYNFVQDSASNKQLLFALAKHFTLTKIKKK